MEDEIFLLRILSGTFIDFIFYLLFYGACRILSSIKGMENMNE